MQPRRVRRAHRSTSNGARGAPYKGFLGSIASRTNNRPASRLFEGETDYFTSRGHIRAAIGATLLPGNISPFRHQRAG